MRKHFLFVVLVATISAACLSAMAQAQMVSGELVIAAVERGNDTNPEDVGVVLGGGVGVNTFFRMTNDAWADLRVRVYTPETWIEHSVATAKAKYETFTAANVTEDMRRPVLRVTVNRLYVERIVIRSADKKTAIQPAAPVPCTPGAPSLPGVYDTIRFDPACKGFEFPLDEVRKIQSTEKSGEFLVTVVLIKDSIVGRTDRDFKVQRKHLEKLPGL